MSRFFFPLLSFSVLLSTLLLMTCRELPTNWIDNPDNVTATISLENGTPVVTQGDSAVFKIVINIPKHVEKITFSFGEQNKSTELYVADQTSETSETLYAGTRFETSGDLVATAKVALQGGTYKDFTYSFKVIEKSISIIYDSLPSGEQVLKVGQTDSLRIVAHTDPAAIITYSVSTAPVLDNTNLVLQQSNNKAVAIITPKLAGDYVLTINAQCGTVVSTKAITLKAIVPVQISTDTTTTKLEIGTIDTIKVTADSSVLKSIMLTLANAGEFAAGEIISTTTKGDTLVIIFTPKEATVYEFDILVTGTTADGKTYSAIETITRTVGTAAVKIWNTTSVTVDASEGSTVKKSLSTILADSALNSLSSLTLATSKGTIIGKEWSYTVPWGSSSKDTVSVSAAYNGTNYPLQLIINIASGDSLPPVIELVNPATADAEVSASEVTCSFTITDAGAGTGNVTFKIGTTVLTDTTHSGNIYSCVVKGLVANTKTTVTVEATDLSMKKNSASSSVALTYNPGMADNVPPAMTLNTPLTATVSVLETFTTIKINCTDASGIGSVTCTKGTTAVTVTNDSGSVYSATVTGLTAGKTDTVTFTATDNSAAKNAATLVFYVTCDPTANDVTAPVITLKNPSKDSTTVSAPSLNVEITCTDASGIASVTCMLGTVEIPVTAGTGGVYTAAASGLVTGANTLTFTATDKATTPNKATKTVTIYYDPSMTDNAGPVITLQSGSTTSTSTLTLSVKCTDNNGVGSVTYAFGTKTAAMTKGTDGTYTAEISGLVSGNNSITVSATDLSANANKADSTFTIVYDPTLTDATGPVITLTTPSKDSSTVSATALSVGVSCTDASGIASVTCMLGTVEIPVTAGTGGVYTAAVSGLVSGANTLIFTATDKATTPNKTTKTVTIYYDKSITDNVGPTVTLKNPASADQRVTTDTVTVQINCADDNGISAVTATRAGTALAVTNSGALYSVKLTALTAGKSDTVNFTALDNSSNRNSSTFSVIVRYNRAPGAITLTLPADGATGVAKKPTLTWTGGDDPDGDAVTYVVRYGTSETSLTKSVTGLTAATTTLTSNLTASTVYYWKVVAATAVNGDSVESDVWSFTTVENAPSITTDPSSQSVVVGNKAIFTVVASGTNPKYQWQKGTTNISNATSASYQTSATTSSDDATTYRCIVSNDGGADTSAAATLTILYTVTYDGNGKTAGTVPSDANNYAKGETVTVKANSGSLEKTGYTFSGWNTKSDGSGTSYTAGTGTFTMESANVTLYAKWNVISYSITYNLNSGTNSSSNPSNYTIETSTITLASPTRTGYTFAGWYSTSGFTSGTEVTTIAKGNTGNVTLYAKWSAITYTITYNLNDGTITSGSNPSSYTIETGDIVLVNPTKTAYTFAGWYTSSSFSGTVKTTIANGSTGNITLYAKWEIRDADGNVYTEVTIGTQTWMVENFRCTKYRDGTSIGTYSSGSVDTGVYYYNGNTKYGAYYNGKAVLNARQIAPSGWHVPTNSEWATLKTNTGDNPKALASTTLWSTSTITGAAGYEQTSNNSSGFSGYPTGRYSGSLVEVGERAYWWLDDDYTDEGTLYLQLIYIGYDESYVNSDGYAAKLNCLPIRLIRDY